MWNYTKTVLIKEDTRLLIATIILAGSPRMSTHSYIKEFIKPWVAGREVKGLPEKTMVH